MLNKIKELNNMKYTLQVKYDYGWITALVTRSLDLMAVKKVRLEQDGHKTRVIREAV